MKGNLGTDPLVRCDNLRPDIKTNYIKLNMCCSVEHAHSGQTYFATSQPSLRLKQAIMIGDSCWGSQVHIQHQGFAAFIIGMQRGVILIAC